MYLFCKITRIILCFICHKLLRRVDLYRDIGRSLDEIVTLIGFSLNAPATANILYPERTRLPIDAVVEKSLMERDMSVGV